MRYFSIPTQGANPRDEYHHRFFSERMSILDCKSKLPKKVLWKGHPFYLELLTSYENIVQKFPKSAQAWMSMPIWFNSMLDTKFDVDLSKFGLNYLRDLIYFKDKPSPFQEAEYQLVAQKVAQLKKKFLTL